MGFLTLADFKSEIISILGGRTLSATRLKNFVNMAYMDVSGAVDFPELDFIDSINTVIGTYRYALPAGAVQLQVVYDEEDSYGLRKVDRVEIFRQNLTDSGPPQIWARVSSEFLIYPVPADVRPLTLVGRKEPDTLEDEGDSTILPKTWDVAIWMLGASRALKALNEDTRAAGWFNEALVYMQSRLIEGQLQMPSALGGQ